MTKIIALSGAKGSGKTTAFNIIKDINPKIREITFVSKLKEECTRIFNIPSEYFHNQDLKEKPFKEPVFLTANTIEAVIRAYDIDPTGYVSPHLGKQLNSPREIMQYIGTELLRGIDDNIHVNNALKNLCPVVDYIVTDMRFINEFDGLAKLDGFTPFHIDNQRAENASCEDLHSSEKERHEFKNKCVRLDNNGSLLEFTARIRNIVL